MTFSSASMTATGLSGRCTTSISLACRSRSTTPLPGAPDYCRLGARVAPFGPADLPFCMGTCSTGSALVQVIIVLRLATFIGRDMDPVLPDLARLCTTVFRDWPHLYDGDGSYDVDHL